MKSLETKSIIAVVLTVLCLSCGNSTTTPPANTANKSEVSNDNKAPAAPPEAPKFWVNIPSLANKTPEEVEKIAGRSTNTVPVTEPPQEAPGENRTYDLAGMNGALTIRFYKGKAVAFTVNVPAGKEFKTADELGKMVGFDVEGKPPAKATPYVSQWNGEFGKAKFAEITIGKSMKTDYNLVRARTQQ